MKSATASEKSFEKRTGTLSEKMFEVYAEKKGMSIARYGFDRVVLDSFTSLDPFVKATPDYVATRKGMARLVECKTGSNGPFINFTTSNIPHLAKWNTVMPLRMFFNDSLDRQVLFIRYEDFMEVFTAHEHEFETGRWDKNSNLPYAMVPKTLFTGWMKYRDI